MNFKKDNRGLAKSAIVVIIAVVAALAIGGVIFASTMLRKDPFTRLVTGYMKAYAQREQKATIDVSLALDKDNPEVKNMFAQIPEGAFSSNNDQLMDFASKVLPKIALRYAVMANTMEEPVSVGANLSFVYDSKELVDIGLTARPWEATVYSKTLLNKPLYADFKDTINEETGLDISSLKIKDYLDVLYAEDDFTKGFIKSKYVDILKEALKDKITSEGTDKVVLSLSYQDTIKLMSDILDESAKDETLKASILAKFDKLVEVAVKNGDYKLTGLSEEDFKKSAEEGRKGLSENWNEIFTELSKAYSTDEFKQYEEQFGNNPIKYIFTFKGDEISKIDGEMLISGITFKFSTTMEKYSTDGFTFGTASDSYSLMDIASDRIALLGTLIGKANDILLGDAYKNMEADIIKTAKESLSAGDAAIIENAFKQVSGMLSGGTQ